METEKKTKFELNDLVGIAIVFVVIGVVISFGLDLLADQKAEFSAGTLAYNATRDAEESVSKLADKLPLVAGAVIIAVIVGLIVRYLMFGNRVM